jgi:DNA mismatch endonuclease (patch repair protein)
MGLEPKRSPQRRAPSFKGLRPASAASSTAMRGNRRTGTRPEVLLQSELRRRGLRYRTNVERLPGRPDLVFTDARVAVFCDGDFWHGRHWRRLRHQLADRFNPDYWTAKIAANRSRDRRARTALLRLGWRVVRCWEGDIMRNVIRVADRVQEVARAPYRTARSTQPPPSTR